MSAQRLGAKKLRRIAEAAGEPVRIGWAHGGYSFAFATETHRHGVYDSKTGEVTWATPDDDREHYTSCYGEEWPEQLRAVRQNPRPQTARRPPYRTTPAVEPLEPERGPDEVSRCQVVPGVGRVQGDGPFTPAVVGALQELQRVVLERADELVAARPAEGEVLDALPDPCPHCPHPLSLHLKGRLTCMYSTGEEPWACDCVGPADQPDDGEGCQPGCEAHEPGGSCDCSGGAL